MKVWTDASGVPHLGSDGLDRVIFADAMKAWLDPAANADAVLARHGIRWRPGCTLYYAYVRELARRAPIEGRRKTTKRGRPCAFTPEQEAAICEDYLAGMSLNTLSRDYGRHASSIVRVLEKAGIPRRRQGRTRRWEAA